MKWSELKEGKFYKLDANVLYITKVNLYTDNCRIEFIYYDNGKNGHWSTNKDEWCMMEPLRIDFQSLPLDTILVTLQGGVYRLCNKRQETSTLLLSFRNLHREEIMTITEKEAQEMFQLKIMLDRINKLKERNMNKKLINDASGKYLIDIAQAIHMGCAMEKTFPTSWEEYLDAIKGTKLSFVDDTDGGAIIDKYSGRILSFMCRQRAEEMRAFCKLVQLRDYWTDNYVPKPDETCYVIRTSNGEISDFMYEGGDDYPLSFQERQTARNFILCFSDLLNEAKHLLG